MKILVTGAAGFIGSSFVRLFLKRHPDSHIVTFDKLTYAGNIKNLESVMDDKNHTFIKGDICQPEQVEKAFDGVEAVVHFAAESHVDRSIEDASTFIKTNVTGTGVLLEAARRRSVKKFVHVSTDEVYGSIAEGLFTEQSHLHPNSPYSASKAGSDLLALSYHATFGLPVAVTRCSNNFGPYQFPEKLIPLFITNAMEDRELPIYGDGLYTRDWIYVDDHSSAIESVLLNGRPGETYNIGGSCEKKNIEITDLILKKLGKPDSLKRYVQDRLGHDRRYAIDSSKIQTELGWKPEHDFDKAIGDTIDWYRTNEPWWRDVKSGAYLEYYDRLYADRLANSDPIGG